MAYNITDIAEIGEIEIEAALIDGVYIGGPALAVFFSFCVGFSLWLYCLVCRKAAQIKTYNQELKQTQGVLFSSDTDPPLREPENSWAAPLVNTLTNAFERDVQVRSSSNSEQNPVEQKIMSSSLFLLASTKFFSNLDESSFQVLYACIEWVHLKSGQVLFQQGDDSSDGMYVVVEGIVGVYHHPPQGIVQISEYLRGESFGEFALLSGEPRVRTCMARCDCELIKISREAFENFIAPRPAAFVSFIQTNIARQWRLAHFVLNDFFALPAPVTHVFLQSKVSPPSGSFATAFELGATAASASSSSTSVPIPVHITLAAFVDAQDGGRRTSSPPIPSPRLLPLGQVSSAGSNTGPNVSPTFSPSMSSNTASGLGFPGMVPGLSSGMASSPQSACLLFDVRDPLFESVLAQPRRATFTAGQILLRSGARPRDAFFVLLSGKMVSYTGAEGSNQSRPVLIGEVLGALAALTGSPHVETVRVLSTSEVLVVSMSELIQTDMPQYILEIVTGVVKQLQPTVRRFVELGLQRVWYRGGEFVFEKGAAATELFVIASGRLRLLASGSNGRVVESSRGECVGETSLCAASSTHSTSIVCVRDSELIKISKGSFDLLVASHPQALLKLTRVMAQRLSNFSRNMKSATRFSNLKTVAVVPISIGVDTGPFARRLVYHLSAHGKCKGIDYQAVLAMLDENFGHQRNPLSQRHDFGPDMTSVDLEHHFYRSRITAWLTELEEENRFLVFEATFDNSPWSNCCIRQADVVLLLGHGGQDPTPSLTEDALIWQNSSSLTSLRLIELVLMWPDACALPSGTSAFLDQRKKLHHFHHLRENREVDFQRLARYLSGRSVGAVFSGGGARGLAHLGTIRALEEQNIPIDYVAGSSQGALMAAIYAYYLSAKLMEEPTRRISVKMASSWNLLADFTLPLMSWMSGYGLSNGLRDFFGNAQIEDLWLPYFCVTTNVSEADQCVHRRGVLWRAVRASMTLLPFLPPMWTEPGDMLIDGGYSNNLPCDIMRDLYCPDILIGVDIENKSYNAQFTKIDYYGDGFLSGWWLLLKKVWVNFNPLAKPLRLPSYAEIITTLSYINSNRNIRRLVDDHSIDIYLHPDLGQTQILDYHKISEIFEAGYRHSKTQLTAWCLQNPSRAVFSASVVESAPPKRSVSLTLITPKSSSNAIQTHSQSPHFPKAASKLDIKQLKLAI